MKPVRVLNILPCIGAETKKVLTQDEAPDGAIHVGVAFVTCVRFPGGEPWWFCSLCTGTPDCLHISAAREDR